MPGSFNTIDGSIPAPRASEVEEAALRWHAHLDAGRLTAAAPIEPSPEIAANRARNEAVIRAHAAAHREALDSAGFWARA